MNHISTAVLCCTSSSRNQLMNFWYPLTYVQCRTDRSLFISLYVRSPIWITAVCVLYCCVARSASNRNNVVVIAHITRTVLLRFPQYISNSFPPIHRSRTPRRFRRIRQRDKSRIISHTNIVTYFTESPCPYSMDAASVVQPALLNRFCRAR